MTKTIHICDRCNKEYDITKRTSAFNNTVLANTRDFEIRIYASDIKERVSRPHGNYELCPDCAGEFVQWLQKYRR